VASIRRSHAGLVDCHAGSATLDGFTGGPSVFMCRVAPDEMLLLTSPELVCEAMAAARAFLNAEEPDSLVVDESDGWAVFTLEGEEALRALVHLSAIRWPDERPAFVQGAVAGAPAKAVLLADCVHLLVPFPVREYVAARLADVTGITVPAEADETPFSVRDMGEPKAVAGVVVAL